MIKELLSHLSPWRTPAGATSATAATSGVVARTLDPAAEAWLRGEDLGESGGTTMTNAYQQVVWVYRAVNVLAEQVANVPFRFSVGEAGGESLITEGPLVAYYARPHPQINRFQYWELRVMWLMLRGECFRVPIFEDGDGRLTHAAGPRARLRRVLILDPANFQHIIQDHRLIGWRYTGWARRRRFPARFSAEEVWHERLPNPFDFWRGLSPLYTATIAARRTTPPGVHEGIIENNGDAGLIVRTPQRSARLSRSMLTASCANASGRLGRPIAPCC